MKRLLLILTVLLIAMPVLAQNATVKEANGRVEFQAPGGRWQTAKAGTALPKGASISTGFGSSAVLEIGASTISVDPLTRMKIEELTQSSGTQNTGLFLRVGKVKAEVKRDTGLSHNFRLRSPSSTAAVRGTKFTFNGITLEVEEGVVAFFSEAFDREMMVGEGEESSFGSNGKCTDPFEAYYRDAFTFSDPGRQEQGIYRYGSTGGSGSDSEFYGSIAVTVE